MAEEKVSDLLANISRSIASLRYHVDTLGRRNYADQRLYISREIERIADAFAAISASPSPPKADGPGWQPIETGNNIGLRLQMLSCENIGHLQIDGEQHATFEDTLPEGGVNGDQVR